jgi:hypothetical protein
MVLAYAVSDGRLAVNPAAGVSLPRVLAADKRLLNHRQVHELADACGKEYRIFPPRRSDTNSRSVEDSRLSPALTAPHGRELDHRVRRGCEGRSADARPQERAMTPDLYGHLFGDRLDVVADAMDSARASALSGVCPLCTTGAVIELRRDAK